MNADPGEVMIDGPDGVAVSLTPAAAMTKAGRLIKAAAVAHGERAIIGDMTDEDRMRRGLNIDAPSPEPDGGDA